MGKAREARTAAPRSSEAERLEVVDVMRGFALTGLFLVHMIECYELYWMDPKPGWIADTVFLLFAGKSFSLLALCFGFSFFILMDRAARRGMDFTARFAWRLTVLVAIGTLHSIVYRGDIIQLLALMGFLLLPLHRVRNNRVLIALAAVCLIGPTLIGQTVAAASGAAWANRPPLYFDDPAMKVLATGNFAETLRATLWSAQWSKWWFMVETGRLMQILGLYIIGMVLGRIGFFARLGDFAKGRWIALGAAAVIAVTLYFMRDSWGKSFDALGYGEAADRDFRALLGSWFDLAGMATWALLLMALYRGGARWLVRPFAPLGRLTLTLYVTQSLVFVPIFYHFGLDRWHVWDQATRILVGLAAVAVQMLFAAAWLKRFHYGPLEWVWRALTY